jgi:hypothetical protein
MCRLAVTLDFLFAALSIAEIFGAGREPKVIALIRGEFFIVEFSKIDNGLGFKAGLKLYLFEEAFSERGLG